MCGQQCDSDFMDPRRTNVDLLQETNVVDNVVIMFKVTQRTRAETRASCSSSPLSILQ